jgi:hypothetical protein
MDIRNGVTGTQAFNDLSASPKICKVRHWGDQWPRRGYTPIKNSDSKCFRTNSSRRVERLQHHRGGSLGQGKQPQITLVLNLQHKGWHE